MPIKTIRNLFFRLKALADAIEIIRSKREYSPSAYRLWKTIKDSTSEMLDKISELPIDSVQAERVASRYLECGDYFHWLLGFIAASKAGQVPEAMIIPLEGIIRKYVSKAEIIVAYDWIPSNYSFVRRLPDILRAKLTVIFESQQHHVVESIPTVLAIIAFPAAERENVLLHGALGHEVGHALSETFHSVNTCGEFCKLEDELQRLTRGEDIDMFQMHLLRARTTRILADWLDELISDAWATWLMQLAPLFALHALDPIQKASEDHPPGFLRFRLMIDCLKNMGFMEIAKNNGWLNKAFNEIKLDSNHSEITPEDSLAYQIVFSTLKKTLNKIVNHVTKMAKDANPEYKDTSKFVKNWSDIQKYLIKRILNYIPPDCIGGVLGDELVPADLNYIINAGWAVYFGYWDKFCKGLSADDLITQYEARKKMNRLLLKGIELSSLIYKIKDKK